MELYTVITTEKKIAITYIVNLETFAKEEEALKYYQIKKELIDAECCEYMKEHLGLSVMPQIDELSLVWSAEEQRDDLPYYNLSYKGNDYRLYIIKHNLMRIE